jgi:signal transduction histidine kinase
MPRVLDSAPAPGAVPRQFFPVLGVAIVAAILVVHIGGELMSPEHGQARYAFAGMRAAEVVLDVGFLVWLSRRADAAGWSPGSVVVRILAINVVVGMAFSVAVRSAMTASALADARLTVRAALTEGFFGSLSVYGLWTLGFRYPYVVHAAYCRALEADRLRERAELVQLRAHLQPHFLRNTLNAVSALMTEDTREARRLLATLGDLLTDSLDTASPRHTLDEEVSWLRRYAQILEARHHGALIFLWDVAPQARGALVPTMLLQPLVENAALHGALCRDGDGEVSVRARVGPSGGVEIVVEDNGPGFDSSAVRQGALGLHLVKRRLALECPGSTFRIDKTPAGTRAVVELA